MTVGLRQLCCRLGMDARSFARGAASLKDAAQVSVGEDLFRQVVEAEGKAVLAAPADGDGQLELDWSASACKATTPDGREVSRVYASCDGVIVPATTDAEKQKRRATAVAKRRAMPAGRREALPPLPPRRRGSDQRYKQVYLTSFYDQAKGRRLVGVTRKDHRGLGALLRRDAARVRLPAADERVGLVDGAACLRRHLEGLPLEAVVLDFRHLAEHVNDASRRTFGDGSDEGKAWSDAVLHAARHEGYEPFFAKLADWRAGLRGAAKRAVADRLLSYAAERREMMPYEACEARGWDVGTGPMESMCGVTTDRVKGRGRRWDIANAEAMMALEALHQSNLWDKYWAKALCALN